MQLNRGPDPQQDRRRPVPSRPGDHASGGHRRDVGNSLRQAGAPHARVPRRPAAASGRRSPSTPPVRPSVPGPLQIPGARLRTSIARDGAADAEAGGAAHGGHRHLDERTQNVGRPRRADPARGGRRGRSAGGRRTSGCHVPVSVTDDVSRARARPPISSRSTAFCRRIALCWTVKATRTRGRRHHRRRETVSDRIGELSPLGVDEFSAVVFDASPEVRERTRAVLLSKDS